jgi:drug/metabolite transporter (DMT)-like permease
MVRVGYLAVFLYGISMVLFLRALHTVDVIVASASMYLVPLFGVVFAFVFLGERLEARAIAGSLIVLLAALILFRFDEPQQLVQSPDEFPIQTAPPALPLSRNRLANR